MRAVVRSGEGLALAEGERDDALEWVVEMRRLPEELTMAALLERGALDPEQVRTVARRLVRFHDEAPAVPAETAAPSKVRRMVNDNLETLADLSGRFLDGRALLAAERFSHAFLTGRGSQLAERARSGRVRDGHGDLRLEHVVLEDGVKVFDCIEFDPALRQIDVAADLAFLVMELAFEGADRLARELVEGYREAGGDPGDDGLLAFYAVYRALVRAKLAYLRAAGLPPHDPARSEPVARAGRLVRLAERFRWRARLPLVLVVCGGTATGKSHLAAALAEASGLELLGSDRTRKQLAGIAPTERAGPEHYTDEFSRATYRELGRRARGALERGGGALVDGTFRRRAHRDAFGEWLGEHWAQALFVECGRRRPRSSSAPGGGRGGRNGTRMPAVS